ncbi:MAG: hypothetical protein NT038_06985, partial [Euryarchaeota archaeon]|nr:hypothetical protein [Euryarchaeota archaeon]
VTESEYTETVSYDPYGSPGHTECYNLTFSFIPDYQFRYAPGDGSWDNTTNATDDTQSWNFMINAVDAGNNSDSITDEFGVYSYTEIMNVGWPSILGNPGVNATAQSNITILTRSNGNYSLSIDVGNLTHNTHPTANMSRDNIWLRGGDLDNSDNFTADSGVIYIYGGAGSYHLAQADGTSLTANDLEYTCDIPVGQMAGDYTATIDYHLITT